MKPHAATTQRIFRILIWSRTKPVQRDREVTYANVRMQAADAREMMDAARAAPRRTRAQFLGMNWFPMILFGAVVLLSGIVFQLSSWPVFVGLWVVASCVGGPLTGVWARSRARRAGVIPRWPRPFVVVGVAIWIGACALGIIGVAVVRSPVVAYALPLIWVGAMYPVLAAIQRDLRIAAGAAWVGAIGAVVATVQPYHLYPALAAVWGTFMVAVGMAQAWREAG